MQSCHKYNRYTGGNIFKYCVGQWGSQKGKLLEIGNYDTKKIETVWFAKKCHFYLTINILVWNKPILHILSYLHYVFDKAR